MCYGATREINAILEYKKVSDTLRGYDRPDASRILSEDIDASVVDGLIQAVQETQSMVHQYYQLKAQLMKKDTLAYHERNVPFVCTTDNKQEYTREQACGIVRDVFADMDSEFVKDFDAFIDQ